MIVYKIGGAVLKKTANFFELLNLIQNKADKSIFVISAFGKTTRQLSEAAELAYSRNLEQANSVLNSIFEYHKMLAKEIIQPDYLSITYELLLNKQTQLYRILEGVYITNELTARTKDILLSSGEDLALLILDNFLKSNSLHIKLIDAKSFLITDDTFGKAAPNYELTSNNLLRYIDIKDNYHYISQGFCGRTISGEITTMGFESSNLTAVLLASILKADELDIITDVDCIYSADPAIYSNVKPIESISIKTANLLSNNGLKLIYPDMLSYMGNSNITLKFHSLQGIASTTISNSTSDSKYPIFICERCRTNNHDSTLASEKTENSKITIANIDLGQFTLICKTLANIDITPQELKYNLAHSCATILLGHSDNSIEISQQLHDSLILA